MTAAQQRYARFLYRHYRRSEHCDLSCRIHTAQSRAAKYPDKLVRIATYEFITLSEYAECWQAVWLAISTGQPINDAMGAA